jgi:hypothetical protein
MFSLIRSTSPAQADALALQRRLIRLFDEALPGWPSFTRDGGGSLFGSWIPPVDVFEDKDSV